MSPYVIVPAKHRCAPPKIHWFRREPRAGARWQCPEDGKLWECSVEPTQKDPSIFRRWTQLLRPQDLPRVGPGSVTQQRRRVVQMTDHAEEPTAE